MKPTAGAPLTAILPISTVRVSDNLVRSRLAQQVQTDQLELFRIQNQLSTGRRIFTPSEDGPSALRAITLQRNLERKEQIQRNLSAADDALSAASAALGETNSVLTDIRGAALSVAGTDATQEQRDAVIKQVEEAIDALLRFGNSAYRDNFLFGGSQATNTPYVSSGEYVEYRGNEQNLQSYVDTNLLFDVNLTGQEAFGGISEAVRGSTALAPHLTTDMLLSQLNRGTGIAQDGTIQIDFVPDTPGGVVTESTLIDLSAANTVGDVARLIEAGSPASADVRVSLVGGGLSITTNGATSGGVAIREVGQGSLAADLGILTTNSSNAIVGDDLSPTLRSTTHLDTLLGTRATTRLISAGANNDLIITATENGAATASTDPLNGVVVQFVDGGLGTAGSESAVYDALGPTLTVTIEAGVSTAEQVATAINNEANGYFTAELDLSDAQSTTLVGQGSVELAATATTSGGSGASLDLASGLLIDNGDGPVAINTSGAETVFEFLGLLNNSDLGLSAQLNADGTGIDVRTRRSGADFTIGENGGVLAEQLGLRTYTVDSKLEDFNRGLGVVQPAETPEGFVANNRLQIEVTDGGATTIYDINLSNVVTVDDLLTQFGTDTGGIVQGALTTVGNGLILTGNSAAILAPATAAGSFSLNGDTITITADTPGSAGNQTFTVEVIDQGSAGLQVTESNGAITVNLGGASPGSATVAAGIGTQLAGFSASVDPESLVSTETGLSLTTTGGVATLSSGPLSIDGDTLTFTADTPGAAGDQTFTVNVVDGGVGGLAVGVVGTTITVDLGGAAPDTAAVAAEISTQLAGYTVVSNGPAAPATVQAGLMVTTAGGAATQSTGSIPFNGNTLTLTADTPGVAGDQAFTIDVVDGGFGGLAVGVVGNTITVNLGGTTPNTAEVAAEIDTQLAGFSASVTPEAIITTQSGLAVSTTGGVAILSSGPLSIDGDTLTFTADTPGAAGDQTFTVNVVDGGVGGLSAGVVGTTITVDLGGAAPDTAAVAAEISTQLAGYTVVSNGPAAPATVQAGLMVTTTGGQAVFSTGALGVNGDTLTLTANTAGPAFDQDFTIDVVDGGAGGLTVGVVGNAITVDLGGATPDSAAVAAAIDAQLADYTVTSNTEALAIPQASQTFTTIGGLDISAAGSDNLTIRGPAARRLGFFGPEQTSATGVMLTAADRHTFETDSAFNTLIRLRDALQAADVPAIGDAVERLDRDLDRAVFAESEAGARLQTLRVLEVRLEDEEVQVRSALSEEIDVDLTEAISEFTARQFALQASLQTSANLLQLSLLDFL